MQLSLQVLFACLPLGLLFSQQRFNLEQDLLLAHYDFKTDVDDLHSAAALATLLAHPAYSGLNFHAVAGTYGRQSGLYVPPNDLMELAFGEHWSDANQDWEVALKQVKARALQTLEKGGHIWLAEGGQSDFSAALVRAIQEERPEINTTKHIHLVQHADWNEEVTSAKDLLYVKENTDYQKIPDGNTTGNGTPGFRSDKPIDLETHLSSTDLISVWQVAITISDKYNGLEGRYLNESIQAGGLDFSDFSEVCWILDLQEIRDAEAFFKLFPN